MATGILLKIRPDGLVLVAGIQLILRLDRNLAGETPLDDALTWILPCLFDTEPHVRPVQQRASVCQYSPNHSRLARPPPAQFPATARAADEVHGTDKVVEPSGSSGCRFESTGLRKVGTVIIDGTKIKANASMPSAGRTHGASSTKRAMKAR